MRTNYRQRFRLCLRLRISEAACKRLHPVFRSSLGYCRTGGLVEAMNRARVHNQFDWNTGSPETHGVLDIFVHQKVQRPRRDIRRRQNLPATLRAPARRRAKPDPTHEESRAGCSSQSHCFRAARQTPPRKGSQNRLGARSCRQASGREDSETPAVAPSCLVPAERPLPQVRRQRFR